VLRRADRSAARVAVRSDAGRETVSRTPAPLIPRQRSVGFDDLIDEGTALLGARRDGQAELARTAR
jgi:hypothetical protein